MPAFTQGRRKALPPVAVLLLALLGLSPAAAGDGIESLVEAFDAAFERARTDGAAGWLLTPLLLARDHGRL